MNNRIDLYFDKPKRTRKSMRRIIAHRVRLVQNKLAAINVANIPDDPDRLQALQDHIAKLRDRLTDAWEAIGATLQRDIKQLHPDDMERLDEEPELFDDDDEDGNWMCGVTDD